MHTWGLHVQLPFALQEGEGFWWEAEAPPYWPSSQELYAFAQVAHFPGHHFLHLYNGCEGPCLWAWGIA